MKTYRVAIGLTVAMALVWAACEDDGVTPKPRPKPTAKNKVVEAFLDNTMYEESDTLSNALGQFFFSGTNAGGAGGGPDARRGLVAFAVVDSIPPGSTVDSVRLELRMSKAAPVGPANTSVSLHCVMASWGEGTSIANLGLGEGGGGSATPGDATWLDRVRGTSLWTTPGGDFNPVASATRMVPSTLGAYTWSSAQMAADVQGWIDNPAMNFGWVLVGDESIGATARQWNSRHNNTAATRPKLTVYYTEP